jgi:hypothetical protein
MVDPTALLTLEQRLSLLSEGTQVHGHDDVLVCY